MDFHNLKETTPETIAKVLTDIFEIPDAMICAIIVKSQIPMYKGELNPKWKLWDDVIKAIDSNAEEDNQRNFLKEIVSELSKSLNS